MSNVGIGTSPIQTLLPCPFCGSQAVDTSTYHDNKEQSDYFGVFYGCKHCDNWFDSADEWNTRIESWNEFSALCRRSTPMVDEHKQLKLYCTEGGHNCSDYLCPRINK